MKFFTMAFLFLLLALQSPTAAVNDTIRGLVADSATNVPLPGTKVKMSSPSCSTFTGADGKFVLVAPLPVRTGPMILRPAESFRIVWNPDQGNFSWEGDRTFEAVVQGANGATVMRLSGGASAGKLAAGAYVVKFSSAGFSGVFKLLNAPGSRQVFRLEKAESAGEAFLAKAAATYSLFFTKPDYKDASRNAAGGANLDVKLAPLTGGAKVDINLGGVGTDTLDAIIPNP